MTHAYRINRDDEFPPEDNLAPVKSPFAVAGSVTATHFLRLLARMRATHVTLCLDVPWPPPLRNKYVYGDGYVGVSPWPETGQDAGRRVAVEIYFDGIEGCHRFACGKYTHWADNLRAIFIWVSRMRSVSGYGVARVASAPTPPDRMLNGLDPYEVLAEIAGTTVDRARALPNLTHREALKIVDAAQRGVLDYAWSCIERIEREHKHAHGHAHEHARERTNG